MFKHQLKIFVFILVFISLFTAGCSSTPKFGKKLGKEKRAQVQNISILVNVLFKEDLTGDVDGIDLAYGKNYARKIIDKISPVLKRRDFKISDTHISIANLYKNDKYYLYENVKPEDVDTKSFPLRSGVLYSERLSDEQLKHIGKAIYPGRKASYADHIASRINTMFFKGDTLLVMLLSGRHKSAGNKAGAFAANVLLLPLVILTQGQFFDTPDVFDSYGVYVTAFRMADGLKLMRRGAGVNGLDNLIDKSVEVIEDSMR